ncbi:hypothetical protein NUW54_g9203 [Trametes sanguinea]|uniref:Uncharacterized protein n=1 Tax=Trametes sanguinea TaxID=158606 RepID=A0ACC1PAU2_9APHY|nr:hypothetical protein NUW54_g9203 [Trametes sanguinea]
MSQRSNKLDKYNPWHDESATSAPSVDVFSVMAKQSFLDVRWLTRGPSWETVFDDLPTIALVYALHVAFRRSVPRRLPTLTPMKLTELYTGLAVASVFENAARGYWLEVRADEDLWKIELVSRWVAKAWQDSKDGATPRSRSQVISQNFTDLTSAFASIRAGKYDQLDVRGKLAWWHNHIWSDEATWVSSALYWSFFLRGSLANGRIDSHDFETLVTHLANMRYMKISPEMPRRYYAIESQTELPDYLPASLGVLALSMPFAMLARWTRLPWLYLPGNALQRLIWLSTLYCGVMQRFQHYAGLNAFQDKASLAKALEHRLLDD